MGLSKKVIEELRVEPGDKANLAKRSTSKCKAFDGDPAALLEEYRGELDKQQDLLHAGAAHAVLLVFQGIDASGKDGTIKHVLTGLNPAGIVVSSFKTPSAEEKLHDYLWRCQKALPERGMIGVFNRSHYEDVLVVRVHPEYLGPGVTADDKLWKQRYEAIEAWETHLARNRTVVRKFFLHVSKDEQRTRMLDRLNDPTKQWKFGSADLAERAHFEEYVDAFEAAVSATSTKHAPWFVIPADDKPQMRALVAGVLLDALQELKLEPPVTDPEVVATLDQARKQLESEG